MLRSITIQNSNLLFLESNSLGRLLNLDYIQTEAITFDPDFDWGDSRAIRFFAGVDFAGNISLEYLLDKFKLPNIVSFLITGIGDNFHTLAPNHLRNLENNKLQGLHLQDCGIEIILNQTFDSIGKHLSALDLSRNKIKHIYLEQFGSYIFGRTSSRILYLQENPIVCDCNSLLVKSVWHLNYASRSYMGSGIHCRSSHFSENLVEDCPRLQTMQMKKLHTEIQSEIASMQMENLVYPKFILKVEREVSDLVIRTVEIAQFKLLKIRYRRSKIKCPNKSWLQMNAKCWLLRNNNETMHIEDEFNRESEFTLVSVFHLTYLRVWPLHLMTIRTQNQFYSRPMIHHFIWIMPSAGWLIGFICYVWFKLVKRWVILY